MTTASRERAGESAGFGFLKETEREKKNVVRPRVAIVNGYRADPTLGYGWLRILLL